MNDENAIGNGLRQAKGMKFRFTIGLENRMSMAIMQMRYRSAIQKAANLLRRGFLRRPMFVASVIALVVFGAVLFAVPSVCDAKMYWTDLNGPDVVQRADLDGTNAESLVTSASTVFSLDVDGAGGKVYYSDLTTSRIYRMNLDGSGVQLLLSGLNGPYGLALDVAGGKIYWTETFSDKIRRANLDGSGAEDLVTGLNNPLDVALDPAGGKMYFADTDNQRICRANLDGSGMQVLVTKARGVRELAVDVLNGYIYWAEELKGRIRRSSLDGSGIVTILSGLKNPFGVALDVAAGKIYYTHDHVGRANLDGSNAEDLILSWGGGIALDFAVSPPTYAISGTVFEDVNYGGGTGRTLAAASGVGRPNVTVELYNSSGAYLANTTTVSDGGYSFAGLAAAAYTVRVVNSTVASSRSGSTGAELAVQTFRAEGDGEAAGTGAAKVGGEQPASVDAPANSRSDSLAALQAPAGQYTQSLVTVNLAGDTSGMDFGFNFDTIVNTNDSGQGTLRQFILNANLLANTGLNQDDWGMAKNPGVEHSIFMIPSSDGGYGADPTGGSGGAFSIQISSAGLPAIADADTAIDGRTQTAFTGDTNGAVGNTSSGPEVLVDYGGTLNDHIFHFQSVRGYLYNVGVYRGGNGALNRGAVYFDNVAAPGSVVQGVTVYRSSSHGFQLSGSSGITISDSIMRNNGTDQTGACGLTMEDSASNTITSNSIVGNASLGIEFWSGACDSNIIANNFIAGNGQAELASGIGLFAGSQNTISQNTITANAGDGVMVRNGATANIITANAIYANGDLGIDLGAGSSYDGDGVTVNDPGDGDAGGNDLLNYPVITSAVEAGGTVNMHVDLDAPDGSYNLEFFSNPSGADPSGNGEGETIFMAMAVTISGSGSFDINFSGASGLLITATATQCLDGPCSQGTTSEFSPVVEVTPAAPEVTLNKSVALVSDPLNGPTNPIIIPGAVLQYVVTVTNQGLGSPDGDTVIITNPVGGDNILFVGDLAGAGSGPVGFADSTPASGLTYTFGGLSSTIDNLSFSSDNGATFAYTPTPDADGYDANVTHLRVTPAGTFAASDGSNHPGFNLQFKVKVR